MPPGSVLEREAEEAARGVGAAPQPGAGDLAVARAPATPEAYDDAELAREIAKYTAKLKSTSDPDRDWDINWLARLTATAKRRASFKQPPKPPAPAPKRKPTAAEERAAAVLEAEYVASGIEVELLKEDEPEPVSMSLDEPGRRARSQARGEVGATVRRGEKEPSKFSPGGFTDDDIYKETNDAIKRMTRSSPRRRTRGRSRSVSPRRKQGADTMLPADFPGRSGTTG